VFWLGIKLRIGSHRLSNRAIEEGSYTTRITFPFRVQFGALYRRDVSWSGGGVKMYGKPGWMDGVVVGGDGGGIVGGGGHGSDGEEGNYTQGSAG
jgi:hypothetical protein